MASSSFTDVWHDANYVLPYGYVQRERIDPASLTTWEKFAEAAAKMTKKENGKTTFFGWEPMWGRDNMIDAVMGKGGKILSDDGKTVMIDSLNGLRHGNCSVNGSTKTKSWAFNMAVKAGSIGTKRSTM